MTATFSNFFFGLFISSSLSQETKSLVVLDVFISCKRQIKIHDMNIIYDNSAWPNIVFYNNYNSAIILPSQEWFICSYHISMSDENKRRKQIRCLSMPVKLFILFQLSHGTKLEGKALFAIMLFPGKTQSFPEFYLQNIASLSCFQS